MCLIKKFKKKDPKLYTQGQSNFTCMIQCLHTPSEVYTELTLSILPSTIPSPVKEQSPAYLRRLSTWWS